MLWQHVVLFKSYVAENAPDYGCVSCVMLCERLIKWLYEMHGATIKLKDVTDCLLIIKT